MKWAGTAHLWVVEVMAAAGALLHVGMTKTKLEPEQLTPGVSPSSGGMIQPGDLVKGTRKYSSRQVR